MFFYNSRFNLILFQDVNSQFATLSKGAYYASPRGVKDLTLLSKCRTKRELDPVFSKQRALRNVISHSSTLQSVSEPAFNNISLEDPDPNAAHFWNITFDKSRIKNFVSWFLQKHGEDKTIQLVEELKNVGFEYATKAGISLGIEDLRVPKKKYSLMLDAEKLSERTIQQYQRNEITEVERFQRLIETWHRTSEQLKQDVIDNFEATDILNPVYMMAFSGARGNISQVRQLVGMRGLMSNPNGQIIDFPIRSNFREGLTLTEYIISSYGARKGIVDTALRTANAGYLTRRLVDVAQHVIISQFDCKTTKGIFLSEMKEGNKTIYSLQSRLMGRVLAEDVLSSDKKRTIAFRNTEVSFDLADDIATHQKSVYVRSPLTCEVSQLVCQRCYGWSIAQGNLVSIGEAVGVVAAQSIGEPGTQLTMRTFHTGGVFAGGITDQIKADYSGTIFYQRPIAGTLIRTPEGRIAFLTKNEGSFVLERKEPLLRDETDEISLAASFSTEAEVSASDAESDQENEENEEVKNKENSIGLDFERDEALESIESSEESKTTLVPRPYREAIKNLENKRYKIPFYTLLFLRNGESVLERSVLAQIANINRQQMATDFAEFTLKADFSGQFYYKNLFIQENEAGPKQEDGGKYTERDYNFESVGWGHAWILSGKIYELNLNSLFFPKLGDFITPTTYMNKIEWTLPSSFSGSFKLSTHLNKNHPHYDLKQIRHLPPLGLNQDSEVTRFLSLRDKTEVSPFSLSSSSSPSSNSKEEIEFNFGAQDFGGETTGLSLSHFFKKQTKEMLKLNFLNQKNLNLVRNELIKFPLSKIIFKQVGYFLKLPSFKMRLGMHSGQSPNGALLSSRDTLFLFSPLSNKTLNENCGMVDQNDQFQDQEDLNPRRKPNFDYPDAWTPKFEIFLNWFPTRFATEMGGMILRESVSSELMPHDPSRDETLRLTSSETKPGVKPSLFSSSPLLPEKFNLLFKVSLFCISHIVEFISLELDPSASKVSLPFPLQGEYSRKIRETRSRTPPRVFDFEFKGCNAWFSNLRSNSVSYFDLKPSLSFDEKKEVSVSLPGFETEIFDKFVPRNAYASRIKAVGRGPSFFLKEQAFSPRKRKKNWRLPSQNNLQINYIEKNFLKEKFIELNYEELIRKTDPEYDLELNKKEKIAAYNPSFLIFESYNPKSFGTLIYPVSYIRTSRVNDAIFTFGLPWKNEYCVDLESLLSEPTIDERGQKTISGQRSLFLDSSLRGFIRRFIRDREKTVSIKKMQWENEISKKREEWEKEISKKKKEGGIPCPKGRPKKGKPSDFDLIPPEFSPTLSAQDKLLEGSQIIANLIENYDTLNLGTLITKTSFIFNYQVKSHFYSDSKQNKSLRPLFWFPQPFFDFTNQTKRNIVFNFHSPVTSSYGRDKGRVTQFQKGELSSVAKTNKSYSFSPSERAYQKSMSEDKKSRTPVSRQTKNNLRPMNKQSSTDFIMGGKKSLLFTQLNRQGKYHFTQSLGGYLEFNSLELLEPSPQKDGLPSVPRFFTPLGKVQQTPSSTVASSLLKSRLAKLKEKRKSSRSSRFIFKVYPFNLSNILHNPSDFESGSLFKKGASQVPVGITEMSSYPQEIKNDSSFARITFNPCLSDELQLRKTILPGFLSPLKNEDYINLKTFSKLVSFPYFLNSRTDRFLNKKFGTSSNSKTNVPKNRFYGSLFNSYFYSLFNKRNKTMPIQKMKFGYPLTSLEPNSHALRSHPLQRIPRGKDKRKGWVWLSGHEKLELPLSINKALFSSPPVVLIPKSDEPKSNFKKEIKTPKTEQIPTSKQVSELNLEYILLPTKKMKKSKISNTTKKLKVTQGLNKSQNLKNKMSSNISLTRVSNKTTQKIKNRTKAKGFTKTGVKPKPIAQKTNSEKESPLIKFKNKVYSKKKKGFISQSEIHTSLLQSLAKKQIKSICSPYLKDTLKYFMSFKNKPLKKELVLKRRVFKFRSDSRPKIKLKSRARLERRKDEWIRKSNFVLSLNTAMNPDLKLNHFSSVLSLLKRIPISPNLLRILEPSNRDNLSSPNLETPSLLQRDKEFSINSKFLGAKNQIQPLDLSSILMPHDHPIVRYPSSFLLDAYFVERNLQWISWIKTIKGHSYYYLLESKKIPSVVLEANQKFTKKGKNSEDQWSSAQSLISSKTKKKESKEESKTSKTKPSKTAQDLLLKNESIRHMNDWQGQDWEEEEFEEDDDWEYKDHREEEDQEAEIDIEMNLIMKPGWLYCATDLPDDFLSNLSEHILKGKELRSKPDKMDSSSTPRLIHPSKSMGEDFLFDSNSVTIERVPITKQTLFNLKTEAIPSLNPLNANYVSSLPSFATSSSPSSLSNWILPSNKNDTNEETTSFNERKGQLRLFKFNMTIENQNTRFKPLKLNLDLASRSSFLIHKEKRKGGLNLVELKKRGKGRKQKQPNLYFLLIRKSMEFHFPNPKDYKKELYKLSNSKDIVSSIFPISHSTDSIKLDLNEPKTIKSRLLEKEKSAFMPYERKVMIHKSFYSIYLSELYKSEQLNKQMSTGEALSKFPSSELTVIANQSLYDSIEELSCMEKVDYLDLDTFEKKDSGKTLRNLGKAQWRKKESHFQFMSMKSINLSPFIVSYKSPYSVNFPFKTPLCLFSESIHVKKKMALFSKTSLSYKKENLMNNGKETHSERKAILSTQTSLNVANNVGNSALDPENSFDNSLKESLSNYLLRLKTVHALTLYPEGVTDLSLGPQNGKIVSTKKDLLKNEIAMSLKGVSCPKPISRLGFEEQNSALVGLLLSFFPNLKLRDFKMTNSESEKREAEGLYSGANSLNNSVEMRAVSNLISVFPGLFASPILEYSLGQNIEKSVFYPNHVNPVHTKTPISWNLNSIYNTAYLSNLNKPILGGLKPNLKTYLNYKANKEAVIYNSDLYSFKNNEIRASLPFIKTYNYSPYEGEFIYDHLNINKLKRGSLLELEDKEPCPNQPIERSACLILTKEDQIAFRYTAVNYKEAYHSLETLKKKHQYFINNMLLSFLSKEKEFPKTILWEPEKRISELCLEEEPKEEGIAMEESGKLFDVFMEELNDPSKSPMLFSPILRWAHEMGLRIDQWDKMYDQPGFKFAVPDRYGMKRKYTGDRNELYEDEQWLLQGLKDKINRGEKLEPGHAKALAKLVEKMYTWVSKKRIRLKGLKDFKANLQRRRPKEFRFKIHKYTWHPKGPGPWNEGPFYQFRYRDPQELKRNAERRKRKLKEKEIQDALEAAKLEKETEKRNAIKFHFPEDEQLAKISELPTGLARQANKLMIGHFLVYGDQISPNFGIQNAGRIIHLNKEKMTLRKGQPIYISPGAMVYKHHDDFIDNQSPIISLSYQQLKTGDIVQGIPKVEQFFEARTSKRGRLFRDSLPNLAAALFKELLEEFSLLDAVRQTYSQVQAIIIDGVHRVYRSQGVSITDKHIEIIVKQMTQKVQILDPKESGFVPGEYIDLELVERLNKETYYRLPISYQPVILGITKASLEVDSFLSGASFQQTSRVLSRAALINKQDFLYGLKENVMVGNLIPAGTGYLLYLDELNIVSKQFQDLSGKPKPNLLMEPNLKDQKQILKVKKDALNELKWKIKTLSLKTKGRFNKRFKIKFLNRFVYCQFRRSLKIVYDSGLWASKQILESGLRFKAKVECDLKEKLKSKLKAKKRKFLSILREKSKPDSKSKLKSRGESKSELTYELKPKSKLKSMLNLESSSKLPKLEPELKEKSKSRVVTKPESKLESESTPPLRVESGVEPRIVETELKPKRKRRSKLELESSKNTEIEFEAKLKPGSKSKLKASQEIESRVESTLESESNLEPKLKSKNTRKLSLDSESDLGSKPKRQPSRKQELEVKPQLDTEKKSKLETKKEPKPKREANVESRIKSKVKSSSKPTLNSESNLEQELTKEELTKESKPKSKSKIKLEPEMKVKSELETETKPDSIHLLNLELKSTVDKPKRGRKPKPK